MKPRLNIGGHELRAVVAADEPGNAARQEQRARKGAPCLDLALLGALRYLKAVLVPEPLHPLMVDDLACAPQERVGAADAEARILPLEALKRFEQCPLLFWVRKIAGRRASHFQEAAGPPLRQAAFSSAGDAGALLLDRIVGLGYLLGL